MSSRTDFQDFHTVVIGRSHNKAVAARGFQTNQQNQGRRTHEHSVLCRLENTDIGSENFDNEHRKTVNNNARFRTKMINTRTALKMNQQQFANHLNINKTVVQEIESGKRIPDPSLIQKINKRINGLL